MADNTTLRNPTSAVDGDILASDDIGGIKYQRTKLTWGVDGTATDASAAAPLPITAATLPLPTGAATAALQPSLGTAGTASANVITVQGIASMTALTVAQATAASLNATVVGNVGSGSSDSGNPLKVAGRYNSGGVTLSDGQRGDLQLDAAGFLKVNLSAGTATTADSQTIVDNAAFTDGTSKVFVSGYILDETPGTSLTENDAAAARINGNRAQVFTLEDDTTRGRRLTITSANAAKVDGSAVTQPISAAALPLPTGAATAAKQPALGTAGTASADVISVQGIASGTALTVTGTITANVGTAGTLALDASVTGLQVSQGSTTSGEKGPLVQGAVTTSSPSYTTAQTSPLSLTTAGALRTDASATTQPISAAALPLPTGASTAAKQPALGTAGTASTDVISVQGIASMTPLQVSQATASNLNATVVGSVASGSTDSTAPVKIGGKYNLVAPTFSDGQRGDMQLDSSGNVKVNIAAGSGITVSSNESITDNNAFTDGASKVYMGGYVFDETAGTALTENDAAAARINANRAQVLTIEDSTTRGRRVTVTAGGALTVDGSASSQPVTNAGTFAVQVTGAALTAVQATAAASYVDGATFTPATSAVAVIGAELDDVAPASVAEGKAGAVRMNATRSLHTVLRDGAGNERAANVTAGGALSVDASATTQPISGSVTVAGNVASAATDSGNPVKVGGKYNLAAPTFTDGQRADLQTDVNGNLKVNIIAGAGSGGTALADGATFTEGTTSITPIGGIFDDVAPGAATENKASIVRVTSARAFHVNLRDASGNELAGGPTQYTEDTASVGAEKLMLAGSIRRDTAASSADTAGDYATMNTDAFGRLYVAVDNTPAVTQSGAWNIGTVNSIVSALPTGGNTIGAVTQSGTWTMTQGTAASLNAAVVGNVASGATDSGNPVKVGGKYNSSPITLTDGQRGDLQLNAAGSLNVNIVSGAGSGGTALADGATFTDGTTSLTPIGGICDEVAPGTATEGKAAVARVTTYRALHVNLRDSSGTEIAVGGGTQYAEDSVAASGDMMNVAGTVRRDAAATSAGTDGDYATLNTDATGRLWCNVSNTVAVSGTVSANATIVAAIPAGANTIGAVTQASGPWTTNQTQWNSNTVDTNSGVKSAGTLRVVLATDQPALTTAMPVSAASLPLPSGASTAAKQPALGTAGTASADVISVQGIASMTPLFTAGDVASGSSDSGNPVKIGGLGKTANPTAVTDGQRVGALFDKLGKQIVVGAIRDLKGTQQTTITSSTAETTIITAVASTFLDVYGFIIANTSATACNVTIKDDTAGTTRFIFAVPAGETRGFIVPVDSGHPQAVVNKPWTATCSASVASISITAMYVKNT